MKTDRHECMHPCPSCARHVRSYETACPFCEARLPGECTLPDDVGAEPRSPGGRPLTRAALVLMGATAITACGKSGANDPAAHGSAVDIYGPAPVADAGLAEPPPLPVAVYGPPPIADAAVDPSEPPPRKR